MFSFLHTADWQIGMMAPGLGAAAERARAARLESLADLLELASARRVDAILVAGDQFEHNQISPAIVEQVVSLLNDRTRVPTYLIPGNHDPAGEASVYRRPVWRQLRDHVRVLSRPEPLTIAPGVTLYPCPIRARFGRNDPTAWIPPRQSGDDGLRVGLAHGTMGLSELVRGDEYPIPLDAADRAGLDYLALGHVHATIVSSERRAAYCGAHETTRFGEGDSGNALVVTLAPGEPPQTERVPTGQLSWRDHAIDLDREDLAQATQTLREAPDAERTLLRIFLRGQARPAHQARLAGLLRPMLQARYLYHRLDHSAVRPPAFERTFTELLGAPYLQQAAERLRVLAEQPPAADGAAEDAALFPGVSPQAAARRALELLQQVAWSAEREDGPR